jgi:iron(III) transport system ATP-binding protein
VVKGTGLHIESLSKAFGTDRAVRAVDDLTLDAAPGEFVVLLGPSGCGKTTLLRCIAGLERPDGGTIKFGDQLISQAGSKTFVPTHKRNLGMVFQSYSLWPHMTVGRNVEYPLTARGEGDAQSRRKAVHDALELVECGDLIDRLPSQLSGGQQQRVALARAIVANPEFILFDEPLSNLDFRLRAQLRSELRELHRRIGFTGVFVTHDQVEAFQLATVVVVLNGGRIEQQGTPQDIYDSPASPYVAAFLGIENRFKGTFRDGKFQTDIGALGGAIVKGMKEGSSYEIFVRARDFTVEAQASRAGSSGDRVVIENGVLVDALYSGERVECVVLAEGTRINLSLDPVDAVFESGDQITVSFRSEDAFVYDAPVVDPEYQLEG